MYPDFLTHYYAESPFRSIMDLTAGEKVREVLRMRAKRKVHRRLMIPNYYAMRRQFEATMREQFVQKGGQPERQHPYYMILGESDLWSCQELKSLCIPLSAIPSCVLSFTYTDSWYAYMDKDLNGNPIPRKPQYEMVFRLEELEDLFATYGWPGERWKRWRKEPEFEFDYYVEAQIWSEEPLRPYTAINAA